MKFLLFTSIRFKSQNFFYLGRKHDDHTDDAIGSRKVPTQMLRELFKPGASKAGDDTSSHSAFVNLHTSRFGMEL